MPRTFGTTFAGKLIDTSKNPRYVIQLAFDTALTDFVYFLSHDDTDYPSGAVVNNARIVNVPATSQTIDPIKAKSTIGTMSISIQDTGGVLTDLIASKFAGGDGLRSKRVRLYVGFEGLAWDDYELFQTQVIDKWTYKDGVYTLQCKDIQRTTKKRIFEPKKTVLDANFNTSEDTNFASGTDAGVITVKDTSEFSTVYHGLGWEDAPSSTVGYLKIDKEIIRYTGKTATTFTGCTGARLGTRNALHETDTTNDSSKTKVEEYIYLDLPAAKMIYAIYTGTLYGEAATLPDHWHLGIDSSYISTTSFTNLESDLWPATNNLGRRARFKKVKPQSGKQFIEDQLMRLAGCTPIIFNDGQLGVKRLTRVSPKSSFQKLLNARNIISYSDITYDATQVVNTIVVNWNYNIDREEFTRQSIYVDSTSQSKHQPSDAVVIDQYGLDGGFHTPKAIGALFDFLRDRYTGPPKLMTVVCTLTVAELSVADKVRVQLDQVRDSIEGTQSLDQTFEIRRMSVDPQRGTVTLQLFGSSELPSSAYYTTDGTALDAGMYSTTSLDASKKLDTFCASSYLDGSVLHIDSNNTFAGTTSIPGASNAAVYWYDNDVYFDDGYTQLLQDNVVIMAEGFITYECVFDGIGGSSATGAAYFGTTHGGGGINYSDYNNFWIPGAYNVGTVDTVPYYDINYNGGTSFSDLTDAGFPVDLRGSKGPAGSTSTTPEGIAVAGGAGGAGGAGLAFVCQGIDAQGNGAINLSGLPGARGSAYVTDYGDHSLTTEGGGGGGGAPGALLIALDGATATETDTYATFTAVLAGSGGPYYTVDPNFFRGYDNPYEELDLSDAARKVIVIQAPETANEDNPTTTSKGSIAVVEQVNTPETPNENLSTLEITITPPADSNYSHHNIYYKLSSEPDTAYQYHSVAADETAIVTAMDGTAYDIKAVPTSIYGVESTDYVVTSKTVSNQAGGVTLATGNYIQSGQTAYDTGNGFFIGNVSGTTKFSFGNSAANKVTWDGSTLNVVGTITATTGTIGGWTIGSTTLANGTNIVLDSSNKKISINNSTFGNSGIQLEYNVTYGSRLYVGDGSAKFIKFDGTDFTAGNEVKLLSTNSFVAANIFEQNLAQNIVLTTSGTGTLSQTGQAAVLTVDSTNTDIRAFHQPIATMISHTWAKDRRWRCGVRTQGSTTGDFTIGMGNILGLESLYFRFDTDGNIYGGADKTGSAATETSLTTWSTSTTYHLEMRFITGTSVQFFVDGTSYGTVTGSLPTGTNYAEYRLSARLTYVSGVSTTDAFFNEFMFEQSE